MARADIQTFKGLLKFSGIFNIIFAAPLAIPKLYEYYLLFFNNINYKLGLGGLPVEIPTNPLNALFINTAGIDLVLIGIVILLVSKNPLANRKIILLNALGRLLFPGIIGYYIFTANLIHILVVFGLVDVSISIGFLYYLKKIKSSG